MRIVITGASGNFGSRIVARLLEHGDVETVVGVVRRPPTDDWGDRVRWVACDVGDPDARDTLTDTFRGADVVVHLAWQIQPSRDLERMTRTNVAGSDAVFRAAAAAEVPSIVYASSVGAYSAGPKDQPVDESWATDGVPTSSYSRHKAEVERLLDEVESAHPSMRVVRFRPGLVFQRAAASEIVRYFLGPFIPLSALQRRLIPVVPAFSRLTFQAVHTDDVAVAFVRAIVDDSVRGAYNLAADPVIGVEQLAEALHARPVPVPLSVIRLATDLAYRTRIQPTDAGWVDMAAAAPVMSTERARTELQWRPTHSATDALLELLDGMRDGSGASSPVLRAAGSAAERARDIVKTATRGGAGAQNP